MNSVDRVTLDLAALKNDLKKLIVLECDKDIEPDSIEDDAILIGGDLDLDSLDALQISMAIKQKYGVSIEGGPEARRALKSVNTLADTIIHFQRD
jgi:acyl carrier protein